MRDFHLEQALADLDSLLEWCDKPNARPDGHIKGRALQAQVEIRAALARRSPEPADVGELTDDLATDDDPPSEPAAPAATEGIDVEKWADDLVSDLASEPYAGEREEDGSNTTASMEAYRRVATKYLAEARALLASRAGRRCCRCTARRRRGAMPADPAHKRNGGTMKYLYRVTYEAKTTRRKK